LWTTSPINVAPVALPPGRFASRIDRVYRQSNDSDTEQGAFEPPRRWSCARAKTRHDTVGTWRAVVDADTTVQNPRLARSRPAGSTLADHHRRNREGVRT
jgi:hypothetical protein